MNYGIRCIASIVVGIVASLPAWADTASRVWFAPDGGSPDLVDLFRQPDRWSEARSHIGVFKFGPLRLTSQANVKRNSLEELKSVDAFAKLHAWGIKIASEEGAVKPWDCTGLQAAKITQTHLRNVHAAGGAIDIIAMDEPLTAGREKCRLPDITTAQRTAAYVNAVKSSDAAKESGVTPMIGDIEPYPSRSVDDLEKWTDYLIADGFTPAFFHIDINVHFVDVHPEVQLKNDLRSLQAYFRRRAIPFGIIFWSGYDPLSSDKAYYDHVMKLVRVIKAAGIAPDQAVFQSWVKRSPQGCLESDKSCGEKPCSASDPDYCGENSIPVNLPESDPKSFSHTRLINDAFKELNAR